MGQELDVAAVRLVLSGVPQVIAGVGERRDPVGADQRAVEVGRGRGQHADALVHVAVGGGGGDPVVARELVHPGAVAKPMQHQHRLPVAAQRPPSPPGAQVGPPLLQQRRHRGGHFAGDVEHGTIGDHVEPLR